MEAGTITVQGVWGDEVVVEVSSDASMEVDGSTATLDDLAPGDLVVAHGEMGDDGIPSRPRSGPVAPAAVPATAARSPADSSRSPGSFDRNRSTVALVRNVQELSVELP